MKQKNAIRVLVIMRICFNKSYIEKITTFAIDNKMLGSIINESKVMLQIAEWIPQKITFDVDRFDSRILGERKKNGKRGYIIKKSKKSYLWLEASKPRFITEEVMELLKGENWHHD